MSRRQIALLGLCLVLIVGCPFLPVISFEADPTSGAAPLAVTFTNNTNADVLANLDSPTWEWDFGDDETSDEFSPAHTYNDPGVYTVTCKLHTANGVSIGTRVGYITVTSTP